MKKLISMTDFVLEQNKNTETLKNNFVNCAAYAHFLKQPLELWMFVPCDEGGNVLELPEYEEILQIGLEKSDFETLLDQYQQAKDRVLFEGFEFDAAQHHIKMGRNIEYLANFGTLTLTASALKQIS